MDYVGCYDVSHNIKMQVTENALQCAFLRVCESKIDISQNTLIKYCTVQIT